MLELFFHGFIVFSLLSILFTLHVMRESEHRTRWIVKRVLDAIEERLESIEELVTPDEDFSAIWFFTNINGQNQRIQSMFLKADQSLPLSIAIKDKFGNAAKVDGAPAWAVTDEALGAVEASEDGMSASFVPSGKAGILKVQVKADADLGEGVTEILGEIDIEVLAGEAVLVEIAAGEPVDTAPVEP